MILLLSPAKTFRKQPIGKMNDSLLFEEKKKQIQKVLTELTREQWKTKLHLTDKLAEQARRRCQLPEELGAALGYFHGEAFRQFQAETMSSDDWLYAQEHLMILSAYYGVLRSCDPIAPYRLDPKDHILEESFRQYWRNSLSEYFLGKEVVSLASQEYNALLTDIPYWQIEFHQEGELVHSMLAKKLRGLMARECVNQRLKTREELQHFVVQGFCYAQTTGNTMIFCSQEKSQ